MNYDIIKKPLRPGMDAPEYYVVPVYSQTVGIKELTRTITRECTLSQPDVVAAISALTDAITSALQNGNKVRIKGLGTFSLRLVTPKEDLRADDKVAKKIKVRTVTFRPDTRFRASFADASFTRTLYSRTQRQVLKGDALLAKLRTAFQSNPLLSRRDIETIAQCSRSTALRTIGTLVSEGYLENATGKHTPYYRATTKLAQ